MWPDIQGKSQASRHTLPQGKSNCLFWQGFSPIDSLWCADVAFPRQPGRVGSNFDVAALCQATDFPIVLLWFKQRVQAVSSSSDNTSQNDEIVTNRMGTQDSEIPFVCQCKEWKFFVLWWAKAAFFLTVHCAFCRNRSHDGQRQTGRNAGENHTGPELKTCNTMCGSFP